MNKKAPEYTVRYKRGECPYWVLYTCATQHKRDVFLRWSLKHVLPTNRYDISKSMH